MRTAASWSNVKHSTLNEFQQQKRLSNGRIAILRFGEEFSFSGEIGPQFRQEGFCEMLIRGDRIGYEHTLTSENRGRKPWKAASVKGNFCTFHPGGRHKVRDSAGAMNLND